MIRDSGVLTLDSRSFDEDDTPTASYPAISPAGGAESLFLAGLVTQNINADRLASKLREAHSQPSSVSERSTSGASTWSALTDDFHSCADFSNDDLLLVDSLHDDENSAQTSYYSVHTRKSVPQETIIEEPDHEMSTTITATPAPSYPPPPEPEEHGADVAEHVYENAKGIWAWGKGVPLLSIGLGITEAVFGKAVSVVGTDLEDIDTNIIKPNLATLDGSILNPAIDVVVGAVLGAAGKTEEVFKPIIVTILSPFGLIKNEAENA